MPLGVGYFFDRRRRRRFIHITEHASDAVERPKVFRAQAVAHLNPVQDRDAIVRHVVSQGFIRVRYYKLNLGWEFSGKPDEALDILRRFIRRFELAPMVEVNLSDFKSGISVIRQVSAVMAATSAAQLGLLSKKTT